MPRPAFIASFARIEKGCLPPSELAVLAASLPLHHNDQSKFSQQDAAIVAPRMKGLAGTCGSGLH
jgi:hypothetical protein